MGGSKVGEKNRIDLLRTQARCAREPRSERRRRQAGIDEDVPLAGADQRRRRVRRADGVASRSKAGCG